MAGRSAILAIRIIADSRDAERGLNRTGAAAGGFGSKLSKATGPAAALVGGLALVGKAATDSASELQQSTGGVQSIFGKYASTIIKNAKAAADAVGLSQSAYQNQAVLLGSQLKNLGVPMDQVAGKTQELIAKAADLAATYGGTTADAVAAIGSTFRGETDPIERYGVSINQAAVKAYELEHGLKMTTSAQQIASKRTATMALLYKQTSSATGQFARETTSAAGAQEIANAKFENAKAALGTRLLPVVAKFKTILGATAEFIARNSAFMFTLVAVIGGLAAAVLIASAALKVYRTIQAVSLVLSGEAAAATGLQTAALAVQKVALGIATAAQWAWNAAMAANPLVLIIAGIALLVAGFILAWKKSETFRDIVKAAFAAVMSVVRPFVSFFTTTIPHAFMAVVRGLHTAWDAVVGFIKTWGPRALIFLAPFIGIPLVIYRHFGQIVGFIRDVWNKVMTGARTFVGNVVSAVAGIPGKLAHAAGSFLGAGRDLIAAFFRGIANAAKSAAGVAVDIARAIVNALVSGINNVLNLPWAIKVHIPIPMAPDVNFGPYTLLPRIPLWGGDPGLDGRPIAPSLDQLQPGFSLFAATAGWNSSAFAPSTDSGNGRMASVFAPVNVHFNGLVTDPDATARTIQSLIGRRVSRVTASGRFA